MSVRGPRQPATVEFDLTQDFPVGLDRLWKALGRADFVERKYRSLGSTAVRIRKLVATAESIEVEVDREAPVARDELPAWARVLSGPRQAMHQRTRWTRVGPRSADAELTILAPGVSASATATGSVVSLSPTHSRLTLHFRVASTSVVLGSFVAEAFARQVQHALREDHAFTLHDLHARSGGGTRQPGRQR